MSERKALGALSRPIGAGLKRLAKALGEPQPNGYQNCTEPSFKSFLTLLTLFALAEWKSDNEQGSRGVFGSPASIRSWIIGEAIPERAGLSGTPNEKAQPVQSLADRGCCAAGISYRRWRLYICPSQKSPDASI